MFWVGQLSLASNTEAFLKASQPSLSGQVQFTPGQDASRSAQLEVTEPRSKEEIDQ